MTLVQKCVYMHYLLLDWTNVHRMYIFNVLDPFFTFDCRTQYYFVGATKFA